MSFLCRPSPSLPLHYTAAVTSFLLFLLSFLHCCRSFSRQAHSFTAALSSQSLQKQNLIFWIRSLHQHHPNNPPHSFLKQQPLRSLHITGRHEAHTRNRRLRRYPPIRLCRQRASCLWRPNSSSLLCTTSLLRRFQRCARVYFHIDNLPYYDH